MDLKTDIQPSDHIAGALSSATTIIIYSDYTSPECKVLFDQVENLLLEYPEQVTVVYRHFPELEDTLSIDSAKAAEAAAVQGKFWEMQKMIFENQENLSLNIFLSFAQSLKIDVDVFKNDFNSQNTLDRIQADILSGKESDAYETPTIFMNGNLYEGSYQEFNLERIIQGREFRSDLTDDTTIITENNGAIDYQKDEPIAYSLDPMPLDDESGYTLDEDNILEKDLSPGITLDEYEASTLDKVEDQDHSDPEPS